MKKFSKIITLVLTCVMLFGMISVNAYAANDKQVFSDVKPNAWYYDAVNTMSANGLLKGYSDGLFHPDDPITYGQFASILCRIAGLSTEHVVHYSGSIKCDSKHWAAGAMWNIKATAIFVRSCDKVDEPLWRGEALTALVNLARQMPKYGYNTNTQISEKVWTWDDISDATDAQNWNRGTHYWTKSNILRAYNLGLTSGVDSKGTCNPTGTVTRAQLCQMLYNMGITGPNCVKVSGGGILG